MAATKIDGTAIARKIREGLHAEIAEKQKLNPRYKPSLKIIQGTFIAKRPILACLEIFTNKMYIVGDRSDSSMSTSDGSLRHP
jgi:5,10-methylene-tetrahydrofolate dehydrogenase/methenyl tetrahydrofolate cyclohydrolase